MLTTITRTVMDKIGRIFGRRQPYAFPREFGMPSPGEPWLATVDASYLTWPTGAGGFIRGMDITVTTWHAAQAKDLRRARAYYAQNGCERLRPGRQTRRYNKKARRRYSTVDSPFNKLESIYVDS